MLQEGFTPYHFIAGMLFPAYDRMGIKVSANQAAVDQALIVTALESHRLAKGGYPSSLGALSPEWLSTVPGDWFSDAGLVYRRNTGGTFTLYSIGYNETDDGGECTFGKTSAGPSNLRKATGLGQARRRSDCHIKCAGVTR